MFKILVWGTVQGVGFRPFVHRVATQLGLKGYVRNTGDGSVEIVIDRDLEKFLEKLKKELPPVAEIKDIRVEEVEVEIPDTFTILESGGKSKLSLPPPDLAVCDLCLKELFYPGDRRYRYPLISCTNCGPRFAIVRSLPFDRENTSLADFPMCEDCKKEYWDIGDRRYYAQTIACPKCGPNYFYVEGSLKGNISDAAKAIDSGKIVAIKGIGGFHIACLTDDPVVAKLRNLLGRPQQPFAIMARDLDCIKRVAKVDEREERELTSVVRPIVILEKKREEEFFQVAPRLNTIGVMLPYAPVHYLLFDEMEADFIVMTSANKPGEPMFIDNGVFELKLDGYLLHNLEIVNRVDDSVVKFCDGRRLIIRRSRGFVPRPLPLDMDINAVAFGAELYNSIAVLTQKKAVVSQYIGNTSNFRTYNEFFKRAVDFFIRFLKVGKLDYVIADMHPLYNTAIYAEKFSEKVGAKLIRVQHHFAHALSVMAEKGLNRAVAITVDGVGYGMDGTVWGGEVLYIDLEKLEFRRVGRLEKFILIGGDLAVYRPLRILVSILDKRPDLLEYYEKYEDVRKVLGLNTGAETTSAGRYLDASAAMLEVCFERTYEGEPAMKLEAIAEEHEVELKPKLVEVEEECRYKSPFEPSGKHGRVKVLEFRRFFEECTEEYISGGNRGLIAYRLIHYLASGLGEIASEFDAPLVISGGVAYNKFFAKVVRETSGKDVLVPEQYPAGDNGISLGQLYSLKVLEVGK